jgi:hypothetical protein
MVTYTFVCNKCKLNKVDEQTYFITVATKHGKS